MYVGVQQGRMPIDDGENKHYPSGVIHPRTVVSFYGVENSPSLCKVIVEQLTADPTDFQEDTLFPQAKDFKFYLN